MTSLSCSGERLAVGFVDMEGWYHTLDFIVVDAVERRHCCGGGWGMVMMKEFGCEAVCDVVLR